MKPMPDKTAVDEPLRAGPSLLAPAGAQGRSHGSPMQDVDGKMSNGVTINLLEPSGSSTLLKVSLDDTLLQVKRSIPLRLSSMRRHAVDHRNLDLFKGTGTWRLSLNCRTLRQYGIVAGDTVTVMLNLQGSPTFDSIPFIPFEDISAQRLAAIRESAKNSLNSLAPFAQMAVQRRASLIVEDFIADRIGSMSKTQCEELLQLWEEGLPYETPYLDRFCMRLAPHFIADLGQDETQLEGLEEQEALYNAFLLKFCEKYNKIPRSGVATTGDICFCGIAEFASDVQARFDALLQEELAEVDNAQRC